MDSEHCEAPHLCSNTTFAGKAAIAVRPGYVLLLFSPGHPCSVVDGGKRPLRCAPALFIQSPSSSRAFSHRKAAIAVRPCFGWTPPSQVFYSHRKAALAVRPCPDFRPSLPQPPHLSECRIAAIAVRPCLPSPRPHLFLHGVRMKLRVRKSKFTHTQALLRRNVHSHSRDSSCLPESKHFLHSRSDLPKTAPQPASIISSARLAVRRQ